MGAAEADLGNDAQESRSHVPVQPVSVAYVGLHGMPMGRENRPLFAWYGDMELVPHLWEALKTGPLDVVVEFHAPLTVDAVGGRKALAAAAEAIVRAGQTRALRMQAVPRPNQPRRMPASNWPRPLHEKRGVSCVYTTYRP